MRHERSKAWALLFQESSAFSGITFVSGERFQESHAATMRRVLVPHRLAIPTPVRAAPPSARSVEGRAGGSRCRSCWGRRGTFPATTLRDIVEGFVGEGDALE